MKKKNRPFGLCSYRGQIEALERALTNEEVECWKLRKWITAARGALNGLMAELVEDHVRFHVLDPKQKPTSEQALVADGAYAYFIRSYLK